jgi:hypothetical protein
MTEVAEPVLVGMFEELVGQDEKCTKKDKSPGWKARINQWGSNQDCDADRLYKNMESKRSDRGYRSGKEPFVKKQGSGFSWNLGKCDEEHFPLQAHHMIPKNHLPTHGVCAFLAKKYNKDKKFKLKEDTFYDNDHAYNGYCLPYATPLKEWTKAKKPEAKDQVTFELMNKTKRQLHQGSHKEQQYAPESDKAEEESGIHEEDPGYLQKVDQLLDLIQTAAGLHTNSCQICKPNENKKEINPRESVVRHVDQVSGLIKLLMDANRIFVSERAFLYFHQKKVGLEAPSWLPGE